MIHIEAPAKIITLIWLHFVSQKITTAAQGKWWCVEPQTCCCWNTICIPLHPQWYLKNHDIDSNHTAWTHKWKFLKYHTICCIQNVLPEEVPTWHISNKRNLEQITNSRTLPHPHPSWWQQLHPINCIPSIFEPITSNFKYSLLVVIENPSQKMLHLPWHTWMGTSSKRHSKGIIAPDGICVVVPQVIVGGEHDAEHIFANFIVQYILDANLERFPPLPMIGEWPSSSSSS